MRSVEIDDDLVIIMKELTVQNSLDLMMTDADDQYALEFILDDCILNGVKCSQLTPDQFDKFMDSFEQLNPKATGASETTPKPNESESKEKQEQRIQNRRRSNASKFRTQLAQLIEVGHSKVLTYPMSLYDSVCEYHNKKG